ncbi:MAG: hypothetical protein RIB03_13245 [Henriciella sp.]|uniref:hypothetical protein n=1 Tax=Henriciella sp. TaxID=1968823 RepID=UPI00261B3FF4|nr:hypothetical protein [Henriciella sp.]
MADIFEEVEEGLRQDRAARLWKKYGVFAYIAAALLIGGVALNEYLQHRTAQTVEESASQFEAARTSLEEQNYQAAAENFSELANSEARIAPLASNYLAEARLQGSADLAGAIAALEQAANTETPIGKLSLIKAAYLKSNAMTRAETEEYLGPLMDEESQFGALAMELVAAKAVAEEDYEYARTAFNDLRFLANVPQGVQQRARYALNTLPAAEEADTSGTEAAEPADIESGAPATDGEQPE